MDPLQHNHPDFNSSQSENPVMDAAAREKHERNMRRGVRCLGAGALLLVASFGINFMLFGSGIDFSIPMYVLTSLGALVALKGMGDIFGG